MVGVGGVVIDNGRTLLIRRGSHPLKGEWSIPGGLLEVGETLEQGVARELAEETGLEVRVVELIEVFERIFPAPPNADGTPGDAARPQYHFVILDYLCEIRGGTLSAGSDALEFAWAREEELPKFDLTVAVTRVLRKAFARARENDTTPERTIAHLFPIYQIRLHKCPAASAGKSVRDNGLREQFGEVIGLLGVLMRMGLDAGNQCLQSQRPMSSRSLRKCSSL